MFAHHELLNHRPSAFISVSLSAVLEEAKTGAQNAWIAWYIRGVSVIAA
jgi:menaquinone-dependent protoporphyrinogen IX oxidase